MPNWVTNRLYLKHAEDARFVLRHDDNVYNDDQLTVDFNILLPMPKDLDELAANYEKIVEEEDINITVGNLSKSKYIDKCIAAGFKPYNAELAYNLQKYGHTNWYDWCCDKWGTKWNAHTVEKADAEDVIIFDTAWATPIGWIEELAKHADFTILYADEDTGANCGWFIYEGGECIAKWDTDEAKRNACRDHADQAVAMSLYVRGWLYDYLDEDARANFIQSYELDDLEYLNSSSFARRLVRVYDKLPQMLLTILPKWLIEEDDIEGYVRQ